MHRHSKIFNSQIRRGKKKKEIWDRSFNSKSFVVSRSISVDYQLVCRTFSEGLIPEKT